MAFGKLDPDRAVEVTRHDDFQWLVKRVDNLEGQVAALTVETRSLKQEIERLKESADNTKGQLHDHIMEEEQPNARQSVDSLLSDRKTPAIPATIWLTELLEVAKINCLDVVRFITGWVADAAEIPFFTHEYNKGSMRITNEYSVLVSGLTNTHLGATYRMPQEWGVPRELANTTTASQKQAFEGVVLEMKVAEKLGNLNPFRSSYNSRSNGRRARSARLMPKYVIEIGEMTVRSHDLTNDSRERRNTFCHVVMDILCEKKGLWLVYRYNGVEEGKRVRNKRKFDRDFDMFSFNGFIPNFDIAQIAEDVTDWAHEDGSFGNVQNVENLIKKTHARVDPTFVRPVFEEFVALEKEKGASSKRDTR